MSVLAHVVLNGALAGEPAATQALAHILNSSSDIARAFVAILRPVGVDFEPGYIGAEIGHEDSRPDLTVHDSDGCVRVFVENKFWAGLTDAQPVSYLEELPDAPPAALLFIVPRRRVAAVWKELRQRCRDAGLEWQDVPGGSGIGCSRVGSKAMSIASWTHVLESLLDAARAGGHDAIRHDILQLQGLTGRMDDEAFLPVRADEVTDQETARRLVNYSDLIEEITQNLRNSGHADTKGLLPSHSWYTAGRFLRLRGDFGSWLGIDLRIWRDAGITPLWLGFNKSEFAGRHRTIRELFGDEQHYESAKYLYIPIRLKTGVERDRVVDRAAEQIAGIADRLVEEFPADRTA